MLHQRINRSAGDVGAGARAGATQASHCPVGPSPGICGTRTSHAPPLHQTRSPLVAQLMPPASKLIQNARPKGVINRGS